MVGDAEERIPVTLPTVSAVSSGKGEISSVEAPACGVRRCSPRYAGKERPTYGQRKVETAAKKKARLDFGKQVSEAPLVPLQSNEMMGLNIGDGVEGEALLGGAHGGVVNGEGVDGDLQAGSGKSAHARVKETLRAFNGHYLHFVQEEEQRVKQVEAKLSKVPKSSNSKLKKRKGKKEEVGVSELKEPKRGGGCEEDIKRASKRPDLKAISKMIETGAILYPEKRIGHLPGIDVGHQFYSRAEMVVLGLHSHWLNGIDYMGNSYAKLEQYKGYKFPLAVCIVLSGMYEDDLDNSENVIYTGQGGHDLLGNKHQIRDQKMERGNLALKVNKYWAEKGIRGFTVFKYQLKRLEAQPTLMTGQVLFTRAQAPTSISELRGLVCEDISGGQEKFPIPATNVVDDPPVAPTGFIYDRSLRVAESLKILANAVGCKCKGDCIDPRTCACARLNGSDFPYVHKDGGRLVEAKAVVFECGPTCGCSINCVNRTSQQGLKYRLEVFRTPKKGWGVRSWDTIPSGAPICEYTGILMKTDEVENASENNYIFDIDCLQTMKGLDGRERRPGDVSFLINFDDKMSEVPEYCINAGPSGNVARFINHSCQPNLFVQCVLSSHHDIKIAKVMLFAADTIPPLQELTYDYGYGLDSVVGPDGKIIKMPCYCGAVDCRKRLY
ncbi:histone-lysine N-methyltransferase, H3 lysine-9 specific SUVH4 isoform X2 [Elaeis guineensis]|uniref:Histone-lysine N-methyltransferase, H3 lysine-9 specific SUVH4 isoform X2 n=1 Tax=Elaeis guineensis var. tenera TaxID=51953 RepID=A0A6J0PM44_ELAGV|nr:histone-lysine N-methyltransferase, H3 lysine-9 specific SUVH4 isoform X2 [Elaeis guineensis]